MSQKDQILGQLDIMTYLGQTVGHLGHPAKTLASQEQEVDLKDIEVPLSERFLDLSGRLKKNIDPNGCSMKTLRECCHQIKDLTISKYSGTISNGKFLTQKISEFHKIGKECLLLDILEDTVCMPTKTRENPNQGRIYDIDGISPCLNKMEGGGREPLIYQESQGVIIKPISFTRKKIKYGIKVANTLQAAGPSRGLGNNNPITGVMVTEATKKGYAEAYEGDSINLAMPNSQTRRGRVGVGVANTLDTSCNQGTLSNGRIRRLTPRECMRLQGVPDYITDKLIEAKISDTQMYRAAGDACTRNVIYEIAKRMNVSE